MHIRCPHCHNPIDIAEDATWGEMSCPSCGSGFNLTDSATVTRTADDAGRRIAHFELVRELGAGQFGSVWMAHDSQLDRTVAIKIPRRGALDARESELFLRDARAAAQLKHPNIARVYEVGKEDDTLYIVSDYIDGASLKSWLTGRRLTAREAAELLVKIARAVHHAHEQGVVHRDLKPGNIMMDQKGEPFVIDFGLAKREAGEITMTVEGQILGTPAYMPPEQAGGQGHAADARSDVYSLGVILYELLTGELPFRGDIQMLLVQIKNDEPPRPRKLNAKIPRDLETITLKCLEKDPAKRYATAEALADDLSRWLDGKPIIARSIGIVARAWRLAKRHPAAAGLSAALALTLLAGVAISTTYALRADRNAQAAERNAKEAERNAQESERQRREALRLAKAESQAREETERQRLEAERQHQNAEEQRTIAERREREAQDQKTVAEQQKMLAQQQQIRAERLLYVSQIQQAQALWESNKAVDAKNTLDSCRMDLRGWEHDYLFTLFTQGHATFPWKHNSGVTSIAFIPDGKQLVSGGRDSTVKIWDAESGQELVSLKGHVAAVTSLALSTDHKFIASASEDKSIRIWEVQTGEVVRTLSGHTGTVWCVAFSPDGTRLASGSEDRTIKLWDTQSGQEIHNLSGHTGGVASIAFSPDGANIVSGSGDCSIKVWDPVGGSVVRTLKGHTGVVLSLAYSPDGTRITSASQDNTVKVWDLENGQDSTSLSGHSDAVNAVAFNTDGTQIASASRDTTIRFWNSSSGMVIRTLRGHEWGATCVAYSSNGDRLWSGGDDGTIKVWNVVDGQRVIPDNASTLAFSPNGQRIATAIGWDSDIRIWDVATCTLDSTIKGHAGAVLHVAFSPDGKRVASGSADKTLKLWNADNGQELATFSGHTEPVLCVAFSPDGSRIATGSADNTIKRLFSRICGRLLARVAFRGCDRGRI